MNKEKRSPVQECVSNRDGGNIYLSPDGSVLGVYPWRNEISGWLSSRGRLCCPAAYTLTQHPLPRLSLSLSGLIQPAAHLIYWTILCVCSGLCACVCTCVHACMCVCAGIITQAPVPLHLYIKWLEQSPPLVSPHYLFRFIPAETTEESPHRITQ